MEDRLCPCEIQVPTHYNPEPGEEVGAMVEPEKMVEILSALNRQFGGYMITGADTPGGLFVGCWNGQVETSVRIEVAVPEQRIDALRQVVYRIGKELKQKAMYFKVGTPCVEIIPILDSQDQLMVGAS